MSTEIDLTDCNSKTMSILELKNKMDKTINELDDSPVIITEKDKPKAVLLSCDMFVAMEQVLEYFSDVKLSKVAEKRLNDGSKVLDHETAWRKIMSDDCEESGTDK